LFVVWMRTYLYVVVLTKLNKQLERERECDCWHFDDLLSIGMDWVVICHKVLVLSSLKLDRFIQWWLRLGSGHAGGVASMAAMTEAARSSFHLNETKKAWVNLLRGLYADWWWRRRQTA
jgi:hypothetical protein